MEIYTKELENFFMTIEYGKEGITGERDYSWGSEVGERHETQF